MSQRGFTPTSQSGTGGIARLGNSNLNPILSEFVDNGTPGNPGDSFITVENRLSQPLNVSPSLFGASPDYTSYFTVPPLTRSTIPIDPERGVLLTVDSNLSLYDRDLGAMAVRTFTKRTIPYRLHSNGAAPSEPLYPLSRCQFATNDFIVQGSFTWYQFVGGAWPGINQNRIAQGEDDICIVCMTGLVYANNMAGAGVILEVGCYYDGDNPTQKVGIAVAVPQTPVGSRFTLALPGPIALGIAVAGANTPISISCGFWIGAPGA